MGAVANERNGGNATTNGLLGAILQKLDVPQVVFQGDFIADDNYVNMVCAKIRDAVQFRGADLGVTT